MNDDNGPDRDPVERLRAADPAAQVEARAGFADEVVALAASETTDAPAAEPSVTEPSVTEPSVTDLASERARRRPRWVAVAAVAASIAIVGAAGYGIGASTSGATNLADGAAPPISLQGVSGGAAAPEIAVGGGLPGAAVDRQKIAGPGVDRMMWGGSGRNSFTSSGLSTAAGTAAGYTYDARAASNAETVTALAAGLGLSGTAELKDGAWLVGSQDGTAPFLSAGLDSMLGFSYNDPTINPWNCAPAPEGTEADTDSSSEPGVDPGIAPIAPCQPPAPGDLPSEGAAIDALRSIIVAAGRDPGAFEYGSQTWEGSYTRSAQAWPVVDGQRIDQAWYAEVTNAGVFSASGALAEIVPLGDYPVASEQEAFERLSDPRFGAQMTAMPVALQDQAVTDAPTEWVPPTEPPATPTAGSSISWPVNQVQIVSARLGLASQWQPDGSVLVVPAYEFTDAAGGTWSVIAVADSKLDFATE